MLGRQSRGGVSQGKYKYKFKFKYECKWMNKYKVGVAGVVIGIGDSRSWI